MDGHSFYSIEPVDYDFKAFVNFLDPPTTRELRITSEIKNLLGNVLTPCQRRIYKVLVKLEREVGWDNLLKLRNGVFLIENEAS